MRNKCLAGLGIITGWSMMYSVMGTEKEALIWITGLVVLVLAGIYLARQCGMSLD
jgi:hypothetical protein